MEILISLIAKVAEYTVKPIGQQANYLLSYKGNFEELADLVNELEAERVTTNRSIKHARRNMREIKPNVIKWLDEANKIIDKANQLQRDPRCAKVGCSLRSFPNLILRYQLSKKATKLRQEVVLLLNKGKFDRVDYLPALDSAAFSNSFSTRGGVTFETRELFKVEILKALENSNACNIGIYGLGGVGKTTLVEEVAQIAKQHKLFDAVVMANISKTPDIKRIQGEIADQLGLQFVEETIAGRAYRLRKRIKAEKTILVILDDMWPSFELETAGIPLVDKHTTRILDKQNAKQNVEQNVKQNVCKLLITSRNKDVLLEKGTQEEFTFMLDLLKEEDTWRLFQYKAGEKVNDTHLQNVATQVARKCAGLPLVIVTVATGLKNKDIYAWKDALRQLESVGHAEMDEITYSALELSYKCLASDELKTLFLLFASLQDNDIEYLLSVVVGLDIFKDINTVDEARDRLYTIIDSLKASCLLNKGKRGEVQMNNFVRDVAISIARRDQHVFQREGPDELKEWPTKDFLKRCPHIILYRCHIHELPQRLDCPNIKFLFLINVNPSLEIPGSFFEGMGSLRVLDLTHLNLSSLPTSFWSLTNLQTLSLDQCTLENMDAIGALKNLEILRLWKSSMIKLPEEIGNLTKIRLLDLSHSGIEVIPPNIISSLSKLEELYMGNTSIMWEDENSAKQNVNASLAELGQLSKLTALELQIREAWILPRDLKLMFEKLQRYKIAIGDVWEWTEIEDGTLKTSLMLKLGTNIHLEHGIKALIKGVESLYLDEVDGIQNLVFQLNLEGFPLLKHLHIQNNAKIKHLVDSMERKQIQVFFINLEKLVLQNLKNLEQICHGQIGVNSFVKLSVIRVNNCAQLKYLLSYSMVKGLSQLSEIEVCQCNSMKEIVLPKPDLSVDDVTNEKIEFLSLRSLTLEHLEKLDNFFSYELTSIRNKQKYQGIESYVSASFFNAQVAFPNLDTLKLSSLNLNKIWGDNQHSFSKLTNLVVEKCGGLKYLFLSSMVGSFVNLKRLEISKCSSMEEIIDTKGKNNGTDESKVIRFSKLEEIILKDMENLQTIWHHQFYSLKTLEVNKCLKITVVFPSPLQKTYNNLEKLDITECASVEEIFELSSNEKGSKEDATHMKEITLSEIPKLKNIWSIDPQGILSFHNLKNVSVKDCGSIEYLFPVSVATSCSYLERFDVQDCGNMKKIVAEDKGAVGTAPIFEFNKLTTLILINLPKLKGFCAGNHTLSCPSLKGSFVSGCLKLNLFKSSFTSIHKKFHNGRSIVEEIPLLIVEKVIPELDEFIIDYRDAKMILQDKNLDDVFAKITDLGLLNCVTEEAIFPDWFLRNVPTLKWLLVKQSSFKKIFQDVRFVSYTRLQGLLLYQLPELQHICEEGCQIDPVLKQLEHMEINACPSLTMLSPSSVTFSHMKHLEITNCNGLKILITPPTAKSVTKLTTMIVKNCDSLEEIITGSEDVEIALTSLVILMLECLPRLCKFCSSTCLLKLPLLEEVVVRECPRMTIFSEGNVSTPILRKVKTAQDVRKWHWKGNLNGTIKNMYEDKVAFCEFENLTLSEYPEMKDLWYGQLHLNVFCNLKSLVVQRCDFLPNVLFPSNILQVLLGLEELEVSDCDSLETVFDVKGIQSKEILVKPTTELKKLTLSGLPKLKHIWNEDPHEIISFEKLQIVNVSRCQSLLNIFSLALCQDLGHLEQLQIVFCGVKEIVALEKGSMKISISFPQMTALVLVGLTNLKSFYPGKHTLDCPSLKTLEVCLCEYLRMFSFNGLDFQQPDQVDGIHNIPFQQSLFSIEKISPNLEVLALNGKDGIEILNGCYPGNLFQKVETLRLQCLEETPTTFLNGFRAMFPNLVTLQVRFSSFETFFVTTGIDHLNSRSPKQITNLWLFELEQLRCIWQEDFPGDHFVVQDLGGLSILGCPNLITLAPSSLSLKNLTYLEVGNCKGLIYLITTETAKSLVQLKKLKIENCEKLLDVVKFDEEKVEEDIIFENLEILSFTSLSTLRSFCYGKQTFIFPSLLHLGVRGCPRMKIFSSGIIIAPFLEAVQVKNQKMRWKDDLKTTIERLFVEQIAFSEFEHLTLSEYPEMKDMWSGQLQPNVFCNLKSLVVQRCDFLPNVLFPSNILQVLLGLEELEVRDCDSLETVFDVKGIQSTEILVKPTIGLKKLTLSSLPNLKHIWNEDPHVSISFGKLKIVEVSKCQSLLNIFSLPLCQELGHLEILRIWYCGVEEVVAMEDGSMQNSISFPQLIELTFISLTNLKSFYPGKHTLECPSLQKLNVYQCEALRMFSFNHLVFPQPDQVDEVHHMPFRIALFSIEKVSPNLKDLSLYAKDALKILNGCCLENLFQKVKILRLHSFEETPITFLNGFHALFPNMVTLEVSGSSLETLFLTTGIDHLNSRSPKQIRNLRLFELDQLRCIWPEDFPGDHFVVDLEGFCITSCPNLITFAPSSSSFKNLTDLEVCNCKGLNYLITTETAKSLLRLTRLAIGNCEIMLDVVKIDQEKAEEYIIFDNLEVLQFSSLLSLRSFCYGKQTFIFPSLLHLIVQGCPKMEIFSLGVTKAPFLTAVKVENGKKRLKVDLNTTIKQLFVEQVVSSSIEK